MLMFSKNVPYIAQAGLLLSLGADSHAKKLINDALAEMTDGICEFAQGYMRADLQLVVAALKATVDALEAVLNDDDRDIPNAKNRQKFCPDCVKKRQAAQSHKSYLKHREYYLERSLAQAERRKQEALEERMLEELLLAKRPEPKYSITQVVKKAKDLGISYGWCSYLLSVGKVCME